MKHKGIHVFLVLLVGHLLVSCAGTLMVKHVDPDKLPPKGLRYHLPQPFLVVYGDRKGKVHVEKVNLPDPTNEYAVSTRSVFSKHEFRISLDRGMLKDVYYSKDDTGVAKELIEQLFGGGQAEGVFEQMIKHRAPGEGESNSSDSDEKKIEGRESEVEYAWGPVWYRVCDNGNDVWLEPVCFQMGDQKATGQPSFATIDTPVLELGDHAALEIGGNSAPSRGGSPTPLQPPNTGAPTPLPPPPTGSPTPLPPPQ